MKRLLSILAVAGGWLIAGVRTTLDLIGWSTAPDDVGTAVNRLDQILTWVLSVPWWVPWGFALVSTLCLLLVSWPRQPATQAGLGGATAPNSPGAPPKNTPALMSKKEEKAERKYFLSTAEKERILHESSLVLNNIKESKKIASSNFLKCDVRVSKTIDLKKYNENTDNAIFSLEKCQNNVKTILDKSSEKERLTEILSPALIELNHYDGFLAVLRRYKKLILALEEENAKSKLSALALMEPRDIIHEREQRLFEKINESDKKIRDLRVIFAGD